MEGGGALGDGQNLVIGGRSAPAVRAAAGVAHALRTAPLAAVAVVDHAAGIAHADGAAPAPVVLALRARAAARRGRAAGILAAIFAVIAVHAHSSSSGLSYGTI